MRRTPALVLFCVSSVLMGAARPTPAPKAVAVPTASPAPVHSVPLVIVFPFDTSTDIKPGTGENAAQVFMNQMNADGGIDTIEGPASVKRADYPTYAHSVHADYYVAGYMTPLGNGVSLVEQVVSTLSGTIVFGQTAQIESIQDATAQATYIHDGIVAREQEISDAYTSAQAQLHPRLPPAIKPTWAKGSPASPDCSTIREPVPRPRPHGSNPPRGSLSCT